MKSCSPLADMRRTGPSPPARGRISSRTGPVAATHLQSHAHLRRRPFHHQRHRIVQQSLRSRSFGGISLMHPCASHSCMQVSAHAQTRALHLQASPIDSKNQTARTNSGKVGPGCLLLETPGSAERTDSATVVADAFASVSRWAIAYLDPSRAQVKAVTSLQCCGCTRLDPPTADPQCDDRSYCGRDGGEYECPTSVLSR